MMTETVENSLKSSRHANVQQSDISLLAPADDPMRVPRL
jgi:hypothetical protein